MKRFKLLGGVILLAAVLCILLPGVARADTGPIYFSVGVPVPTTSNDIRMTREVLTIEYTDQVPLEVDGYALVVQVHAQFWFRNEGKAVTQHMGFPLGREVLTGFGSYGSGFTAKVDGKTLKTTAFPPNDKTSTSALTYSLWNAFDVPFAAGQTRMLDVRYQTRSPEGYFLYVLQTGRLWKGPIGDLSIDVNFGRTAAYPDLLSVQPVGYHIQGTHILWHFTGYEPEQDIEIESMDKAFWQAVAPLKKAAEKQGTADAWYRYAMALLPESIVGSYEPTTTIGGKTVRMNFVQGVRTSSYADFVQRTLLAAINHCPHGSEQERILSVAYSAHFSYFRNIASFLDGVTTWQHTPSLQAHTLETDPVQTGTSLEKPSSEELRLLTWLQVNMAGESMTCGCTLSSIHELQQAQVLATRAGLSADWVYQDLFERVLSRLAAWSHLPLPINISGVPRIEVQQQKIATPTGSPAWRARIVLHIPLLPGDYRFVTDMDVSALPDWTTLPTVNDDGTIEGSDKLDAGFAESGNGDYLVVLTLHGERTPDEVQEALTSLLASPADEVLLTTYMQGGVVTEVSYPVDAAHAGSLQSAAYTWLQGIAPAIRFDPDHGVTLDQSILASCSEPLCDRAEAELGNISSFLRQFSWMQDQGTGTMLQREEQLIGAARGQVPVVTMVTYAPDGTVQCTTSSDHNFWSSRAVLPIVCALAGLVAGFLLTLLLRRRKTQSAPPTPPAATSQL